MDLGRLRSTEWIVAAFSAALFGVMFLDWYEPRARSSGLSADAGLNAWHAFAATDVVLAAAAGCGLMLALLTATQATPAVPIAWSALTCFVTTFASVWLFVRVLSLPDGTYARSVGPTLGFALVLGLNVAVWFSTRNERPGHGGHARGARRRITEIETLPAPEPR
jgi:hypothetical protein